MALLLLKQRIPKRRDKYHIMEILNHFLQNLRDVQSIARINKRENSVEKDHRSSRMSK